MDPAGACRLGDGPDAFSFCVPEPEEGGDGYSFAVGYCGAKDFGNSKSGRVNHEW